jgi:hypothetical protein
MLYKWSTYLPHFELQSILPQEYTENDSILIVQKYMDEWVTDQMLMKNARPEYIGEKQHLDLLIGRYKTGIFSGLSAATDSAESRYYYFKEAIKN